MQCPYCVSDIPDTALACAHCGRDLYLFKPLLQRIAALEQTLKEHAAATELRYVQLAEVINSAHAGTALPVDSLPQSEEVLVEHSAWVSVLVLLLPALLVLVASHWVLLFLYDVKPLYLRIATILMPMPFGLCLAMRHPRQLWPALVSGFVVAGGAVLGMLWVTASIDHVPLWPESTRDWRELVEYILGIGLAFATGIMAAQLWLGRRVASPTSRVIVLLAKSVTRAGDGTIRIAETAKKIGALVSTLTPAVTGATAVYAGIKSFLN